MLTVVYERLLENPEIEAKKICQHVGIEWDDHMLRPGDKKHLGAHAITKNSNEIWYDSKTYNRNITVNDSDKWKKQLSLYQQLRVTMVFSGNAELRRSGYDFSLSNLVHDRQPCSRNLYSWAVCFIEPISVYQDDHSKNSYVFFHKEWSFTCYQVFQKVTAKTKMCIKKGRSFYWFGEHYKIFCLWLSMALLILTSVATSYGANLVPDPSFETGTASWDLGDYASSIDNTIAQTGSNSLKLINDGSASNHNAGQYNIGGVEGGEEYEYSVWVRGDAVTGVDTGGKPLAVVRWRNGSGSRIEKEMYLWAPYGTYDWRELRIYLQAPPTAAGVDISFRSWYECLTGSTNWDDVSLAPRDLSYRGSLTGTYQAEVASSRSGGSIETTETNYTGSGYFHPTVDGAYVEWNDVSGGASGGTRILSFRYAWEGNLKNIEVIVNSISQGSVKPLATGRVNSWASSDWEVSLQPGNNMVRLRVSQVTAGPNIDKLDVFQKAGSIVVAATPTITPNGGEFSESVAVSLETTTPGAVIYYTTDGSTPNESSIAYSSPFTLTADTTVKAYAVASGYTDSTVASADFMVTADTPTVAAPTIAPDGGEFSESVAVSLETTTPGAVIYYTTDGTIPSMSSSEYTGPFTLSTDATVNAFAAAVGYDDSAVAMADFTVGSAPAAGSGGGGCFIRALKKESTRRQ